MAVSGVGASLGTSNNAGNLNPNTVEGMQDQFMQILLTQLRYQDPMEPMQEKDFFAQMAQFSAATEMKNLSTKMDALIAGISQLSVNNKLLAAASLVGTGFTAVVDGEMVSGTVDSAVLVNGTVYVKSGEWLIPVDCLIEMGVAADAS